MAKAEKIRLYYGAFTGLLTVALGVLFIFEAADLYYSGVAELGAPTGMYSRAEVVARLKILLAPLLVWAAAVIAGFAVFEAYPASRKTKRPDPVAIMERLSRRIPVSEGADYRTYRFGERMRLCARGVCALFCAVAAVFCAVYLFRTANFPREDLHAEILNMLKNVLPWVCVSFFLLVAETVFEYFYAKKTLPAVKRLAAAGRGATAEPSSFEKGRARAAAVLSSPKTVAVLRIVAAAVAIVFLIVGGTRGEAVVLWTKAKNICTECIGLG